MKTPTPDERARMRTLYLRGYTTQTIGKELGFKPIQVHRVLLADDAYRIGTRW